MKRQAKRILGLLAGVGLGAGSAAAECGGQDIMARLAVERPEAHRTILAEAAAIPNGQGRFWRVERPGAEPSWLLATYHDTTAIGTMPPEAEAAFEDAGTLVVELTTEEMARMNIRIAEDPSFTFAPEGAGIAERLDAETLARAEAVLARRGLTVEVAERLRPWIFFSLMGIPACEIRNISAGAQVMDQELLARAAAAGKRVEGLETYEEALGAFGEIDPETAAAMARDFLLLAEREEDLRATMLALYARGQVAAIDSFSDWIGTQATGRVPEEAETLSAAFEEAVLDQRNARWMTRLTPILAEGGAFVAVGGLHLPGEAGLVALLREAGFTVTRADG